jgi:hypothetical protein
VYEITVSQTLNPGLYWVGGAVQGVSTTQPTMRVMSLGTIGAPMPMSAIPTAAQTTIGYSLPSVTGASPTLLGVNGSGSGVRIFYKVA